MCNDCQNWGCVLVNRKWKFCTCMEGRDLQKRAPDWIDFCNGFKNPKHDGLKRAAEIVRQVVARRQGSPVATLERQPGDE